MKSREQAERLFYENENLAYHIAWKYIPRWPDHLRDDILNEALIGLWKAAQTFDPAKGTKFSTWCGVCVAGAINHLLRALYRQERGVATSLDRDFGGDEDELEPSSLLGDGEGLDSQIELRQALSFLGNGSYLWRNIQGYTQREIAKEAGFSQAHVSRLIQKERDAVQEALGA